MPFLSRATRRSSQSFSSPTTICRIFLFQELGTFACLSLSRLSRRSSQSFSSPTNHLSDFSVPRTRHLCMPFSVSTIEALILVLSTPNKPYVGFSCSKNKAPLHAFLYLDYRDAHPRAFHHRQTIYRDFQFQELDTFAYPRLDQRDAYTGAYHYLFLLPIHHVSEFPVPRIKYLYITLPYLGLRDLYFKAFHHRQTICRNVRSKN